MHMKSQCIIDFDIRMCYWGDGTAGKILNENETYSGEYKIQIHNKLLYNRIFSLFLNFYT